MLRIGTRAIVSFPNFGHWRLRAQLLLRGRMPMTESWAADWYETPNIHPCTIRDFFALCEREGYTVQRWFAVDDKGDRAPWKGSVQLANLFGEQALFLLHRSAHSASYHDGRAGSPLSSRPSAADPSAGRTRPRR